MTNLLAKWTETALGAGMRVALIFLFAVALARLLKVLTRRLVKLAESQSRAAVLREEQTRTLAGIIYSTGVTLIAAFAVLTVLPEFGVNVTPIAAAAGLVSLALGFGAQHLVRDLINGFFIVFEDQFTVGDQVHLGDLLGRVEHLTLRRTVLRDPQGALITIPNGEIRQVANLSRDWSQLYVDVTIPSEENAGRALTALEQVSAELRSEGVWAAALVDGPRLLGVESLSLEGTTLRVMVRTAPTRQHDVARELRRRIRARFEQEQIGLGAVQQVRLVRSDQQPGGPQSS